MEQNKIYITDYIKLIFSRKLLFSLITIIGTVVLFLILYFGISKPRTRYNVTFSYSNSQINEEFDYKELISSYNLETAKSEFEDFESIDVNNIIKNNYMSISKNNDDTTYTLTISAKGINNKDLATAYIQSLLNLPIERLVEINSNNYHSNFDYINASILYDKKIDYIENQYYILNNAFSNIITNNKSSLKASEYNDLIAKYSKFTTYFINVDFSALRTESINNGYVEDFNNNKDTFISSLTSQIENYITIIEKINLINSTTSILDSNYYNLLDSLYETKNEIKSLAIKLLANSYSVEDLISSTKISRVYTQEELTEMKNNINQDGYTQFKETINNIINSLNNYTNEINEIEKTVYSNINVQYNNTNVIEVTGNISNLIIVIVSFILSVIVACVVVVILDHKKLYKEVSKEA